MNLAMQTPFSLRIFVVDGDPDGLLTRQNQRRWANYRVAGDSPHLAEDSPQTVTSSPHLIPELLSLAKPARIKTKLPADQAYRTVLQPTSGQANLAVGGGA